MRGSNLAQISLPSNPSRRDRPLSDIPCSRLQSLPAPLIKSAQRTLLVLMDEADNNTSRIGEGAISGTKTLQAASVWRDRRQPRYATPMHTAVRVFSWYGESCKRSSDGMSDHKFKVGQTVSYQSGFRVGGSRTDVFKIMQCLPPQGGDFQYRIRGVNEPHDRVAKESELERTI
jgi:hypothetical protein